MNQIIENYITKCILNIKYQNLKKICLYKTMCNVYTTIIGPVIGLCNVKQALNLSAMNIC